MLEEVGNRLVAEGINQFLNSMRSAEKATESFGGSTAKVVPTVSSLSTGAIALGVALGQALYNGAIAAGRAIIDLARQGMEAYKSYEMMGMALTSLTARELVNTGQAKDMTAALAMAGPKAKELLAWVQKLAIQSPFTSEGVAAAFKTAMAYGFTTDESKRLTQAMIDFSSATGASEDSMGRIALALGQIKARGKLAGGEVMQLTEAGLPVWEILGKAFGKTTAEIQAMSEKGLIPADKAIEAITASLEKDFGGAAARTSGTFSGLLSSLEDIKSVGLREFFTGTFQAIQPYLAKFVDFMTRPETLATIQAWGKALGDFVAKAIDFGQRVFWVFDMLQIKGTDLGGLIATAFGPQAGATFDGFMAKVQEVFTAVVTFFQPVIDGWNYFVGVFNTTIPMLNGIWQGMLATVQTVFGGMDQTTGSTMSNIMTFIGQALKWIADAWQKYGKTIMDIVKFVWDLVITIIGTAVKLIIGMVNVGLALLRGDWEGAWEAIKATFESIWNTIVAVFGERWAALVAWASGAWASFTDFVSTTWDNIRQRTLTYINKIITDVSNFIQDIPRRIAAGAGALASAGVELIMGLWGGIKRGIDDLIGKLRDALGTVINLVRGIFQARSPSKVFEDIGLDLMTGMALGILKGISLPMATSAMAAQATIAPASIAASPASYSNVTNYNLSVMTSQSPAVVQRSFAILKMLA